MTPFLLHAADACPPLWPWWSIFWVGVALMAVLVGMLGAAVVGWVYFWEWLEGRRQRRVG